MRKFPRKVKRIVIKVGSGLIATYSLRQRTAQLRSLVDQMSVLHKDGIEVILVSSGAIVLGMGQVKSASRPKDVASLQACAAIGQGVLMRTYSDFFKRQKITCAQVLLTWDDFDNRGRYNNARNTLNAILKYKGIPIINENDTISTDEIKFGDNDRLSAMVASLVRADLLVILSDVEGLYEVKNGKKQVFREVKEITKEIEAVASGTTKQKISKGGMAAKLDAVKIATHANIPCIIAHGHMPNVLHRIVKNERIGTFFMEKAQKSLARKHWISFGAKPKGMLYVDDGAKAALLERNKSLLLPGIVKWEGHFKKNDVVIVCDKHSNEIARGITKYSAADIAASQDDKKGKTEVIHRDHLVPSKR